MIEWPELPNVFAVYLTICTVVRFWADGNFRYLFLNNNIVMPVQYSIHIYDSKAYD